MSQYINRTVEKQINNLKGSFPVILVAGTKLSGKSTLFEYINSSSDEEIEYVSFDNIMERTAAKEDPEKFINTHKVPLIIDEFGYVPEILSYIKMKIDEAKRNSFFGDKRPVGTMYYLIGSQTFQTMKDISESLSGRIGIIDLYPLSNREIQGKTEECFIPELNALKDKEETNTISKSELFKKIIKGSYPTLCANSRENSESFYSSYTKTYIEKDIRNIIGVRNETKFFKFTAAVAARTGQEYNASELAKEVGIDSKTADEWISVLKDTYLVYLMQPYGNSTFGRAVKRPKIYFMDTGLACFLTGYTDYKVLQESIYSDAIFKTYIVSEIIKSYTNNCRDPRLKLFYYRDNNNKEIDLLIVEQNCIYPIKIRKDTNISQSEVNQLNIVDSLGRTTANGAVICMADELKFIDDRTYILPI